MSCDLRLEEQGRVEAAMESYREALELDPGEETAKGRLEALVAAIEAKVCWWWWAVGHYHLLTSSFSLLLPTSLPHVFSAGPAAGKWL